MGKDDKDVLAGLRACRWVDEGLNDVGVVHVEIPTKDAPENTLESRNACTLNRACNESII